MTHFSPVEQNAQRAKIRLGARDTVLLITFRLQGEFQSMVGPSGLD